MLDFDLTGENIAVLKPRGALSAGDFSRLTKAIDDYINQKDKIPNFVIDAQGLPYWNGLPALIDHLRFIRNHHRLVRKVAIVSDTMALKAMPHLADHFLAAKVRHFPRTKLDDAKQWAEAADDHPGRFEPIEGLPSDVVANEATGIITSQDYRDMLVPLVDEKLKVHRQIKVLVVMGERFTSYSGSAAWDDMRFGFSHWADFSKIALVTDLGWISHAAKLFAPLMKADLHVFALTDLDDAKAWIKS